MSLRIALLQLKVSPIKTENFHNINRILSNLKPVDILVLPECFNSPYSIKSFKKYSESIPNGETTRYLQDLSKAKKTTIIGGSFPELGENNKDIYNTSIVLNEKGELLAKHRKVHLFDVDIPNKISFQESRILSPGNSLTHFNTKFGNIGLGICYDLRFPELAMKLTRPPLNSFMMCYPGAFNTITGPLHWESLAKARALDNQCFVVLCSPARDLNAKYHAYGHSLIVDPMGQTVVEAGEDEELIYADLDLGLVDEFRSNVPLNQQRRFDIYGKI